MKKIKSKDSFLIRQSNDITLAIQNFSKQQRDCLYLIMQQVNMSKFADRMKNDNELAYEVKIQVKLVKELFENDHPKRIADVFTSLVDKTVKAYDPETGSFIAVSLIGSASYTRGDEFIRVAVMRELIPYFDALVNKFTAYNIRIILGLSSVYAQRFYEILNMFKALGKFKMSVEMIKQRFCITGKSYENYNLFKSRVLDIAKAELDRKFNSGECDLTFTYKPFSFVGKRVDEIEFTIIGDKKGNTSDIVARIDHVMKYVARVSGKNNDYLLFVKNSLAMLDITKLDEIIIRFDRAEEKAKANGERLKGELIYYILKSDFGIDYRNQKQSAMELINKKFNSNEYLCEEEVIAYFKLIGLQKKSDILDYIKAKIDKDSKQFNDCEEYVKEVYYSIGEEWELKNTVKRKPESRVLPDDDELVNQEYPKYNRRKRKKDNDSYDYFNPV